MKTILVSVLVSVILAISVLLVSGTAVTEKSFNETYGQTFSTAQWLTPDNNATRKLGIGSESVSLLPIALLSIIPFENESMIGESETNGSDTIDHSTWGFGPVTVLDNWREGCWHTLIRVGGNFLPFGDIKVRSYDRPMQFDLSLPKQTEVMDYADNTVTVYHKRLIDGHIALETHEHIGGNEPQESWTWQFQIDDHTIVTITASGFQRGDYLPGKNLHIISGKEYRKLVMIASASTD